MTLFEKLQNEIDILYTNDVLLFADFLERRFGIDKNKVTSHLYREDNLCLYGYCKGIHETYGEYETVSVDTICTSCYNKVFFGYFEWHGDKLVAPITDEEFTPRLCMKCEGKKLVELYEKGIEQSSLYSKIMIKVFNLWNN